MQTDLNDYTIDRFQEIRGAEVYSSDEQKIGKVEELFTDIDTRRPEWIGVGTGIFRTKRVLVPVQGATWTGDTVRVPFTKDHVQGAPDIDADEIEQDTEDRLAAHFGMDYSEARSETGLPESPPAASGDSSLTRSEEELTVGTKRTEAGRVRLHKWVDTVPVEETVHLNRDVAEVRVEPVGADATAGTIGDQEIEVALERDEPVVEKRTVAKERVSIDKATVTDDETVTDTLDRERVEVEGDPIDVRGDRVQEQR